MALGVFTITAEIGQRARTNWRALATDIFIRIRGRPNEKVTVEGGVSATRSARRGYSKNDEQHRQLRSALYDVTTRR